jgi:hypothetical protein
MSGALKEMNKAELVNLERLAHLLEGLSPSEVEPLELLLDEEASVTIVRSRKELEDTEEIPMAENA